MTRTINPGSVLDRLKHLRRMTYPNIPANTMLLLYAQQGLLGRLQASPYAGHFVLKGALSLFARYREAARPTQDIDLAATGVPNTPGGIARVLEEIGGLPFGDGLTFDPQHIRTSVINETFDYPGVTARMRAALGASQVNVQLDLSFGNVITPAPVTLAFPPLLLDEAVRVSVYPLETVVTEKFAALVEIGAATTRMKDLYDLHAILSRETFEAALVREALDRSFTARGTPRDAVGDVLSAAFAEDAALSARLAQYGRRTNLTVPPWGEVMALVRAFYGPILLGNVREGAWQDRAWTSPP